MKLSICLLILGQFCSAQSRSCLTISSTEICTGQKFTEFAARALKDKAFTITKPVNKDSMYVLLDERNEMIGTISTQNGFIQDITKQLGVHSSKDAMEFANQLFAAIERLGRESPLEADSEIFRHEGKVISHLTIKNRSSGLECTIYTTLGSSDESRSVQLTIRAATPTPKP